MSQVVQFLQQQKQLGASLEQLIRDKYHILPDSR
jgi:hypothetical protein